MRLGEIETQPLRWMTGVAGGTRTWSRPKVGEQVLLLAPEGDMAGAIALRGVVSTAHPPIADDAREIVEFEDGTRIAHDPAAKSLEINVASGGTLTIRASGGITLEGDVLVKGKITAEDDVLAGSISLQQHRHRDVQPGSGLSGVPQ